MIFPKCLWYLQMSQVRAGSLWQASLWSEPERLREAAGRRRMLRNEETDERTEGMPFAWGRNNTRED